MRHEGVGRRGGRKGEGVGRYEGGRGAREEKGGDRGEVELLMTHQREIYMKTPFQNEFSEGINIVVCVCVCLCLVY